MPPSSSGPGCQVLSLKTGVQIPLGVHIIVAKDAMETIHPIKRISSRISSKTSNFNFLLFSLSQNQNNDRSKISTGTPQSEIPNPKSDKVVGVGCVKRSASNKKMVMMGSFNPSHMSFNTNVRERTPLHSENSSFFTIKHAKIFFSNCDARHIQQKYILIICY